MQVYQKDFFNSARRPPFTWRSNPVHPRSFLILKRDEGGQELAPYATYTGLDPAEDTSLTERKVMNLVSLLNGHKAVSLGEGTGLRTLHSLPDRAAGENSIRSVVFYTLGVEGPSRESAILTLETAEAGHA